MIDKAKETRKQNRLENLGSNDPVCVLCGGAKKMAEAARLSERHIFDVGNGQAIPSERAMAKLHAAAKSLDGMSESDDALRLRIKAMMEERQVSIRGLAATLKTDPSNLAKVLSGGRKAGELLIRIQGSLMDFVGGKI